MSHAETILSVLRFVPGFFLVNTAIAGVFCFWIIPSGRSLFWSVIVGIGFFMSTAICWRVPRASLFIFLATILGYKTVQDFIVRGGHPESFQGLMISFAVSCALLWLLRRPVIRFARLEGPDVN
jgi:hypothetical protein